MHLKSVLAHPAGAQLRGWQCDFAVDFLTYLKAELLLINLSAACTYVLLPKP